MFVFAAALAVVGCGDDGGEAPTEGTSSGGSSSATPTASSGETAASSVTEGETSEGETTGDTTTDGETTSTTEGETSGNPGDQSYFDMLVARPEHHSSTALGSVAEVDEGINFSDPADSTTTYDGQLDAAKFIVPANSGSLVIGDQVRHQFERVDSGSLFIFWEARASAYWSAPGAVDGVETHKAFQISDGGDLTLEPRFRFVQSDPPFFARADMRVYGDQSGVEVGPADSVAPQAGEFEFLPETWTRFWVVMDFDQNQLSYWVGDTDQPITQVLDDVPFDWTGNYGPGFGVDEFWFEFNTSQARTSDEEPCFWGRNLAILRDVEDPDALVALGELTE